MLPVVIFEPDGETREFLCRCVASYNRDPAVRMSLVADTDSIPEMARYLESVEGIGVWMLGLVREQEDARNAAVRLGLRAIRRNRDHYLLYCLHDLRDLEALLNTGVRPAGVITFPLSEEKVLKLLGRINADYNSMHEQQAETYLVVDSGNATYRIPYSRILYIEAMEKKLNIWTERQVLAVRMTINSLEQTLPKELFVRCHRSFIVNLKHVQQVDYTAMTVTITNGDTVVISRGCRDQLRDALEAERGKAP